MTDEELSLKIAEFLFPKDPTRCERCGWPIKETLDEGCTASVCRMVDPPVRRTPDFINDSHLRDLLQAKLLEEGHIVSVCKLDGEYKLRLSRRIGGKILRFDFYGTRERLWAEAFANAKGLL